MDDPKLLIMFFDEDERWGALPLFQAVMNQLEFSEVAGATALKGIRGFSSAGGVSDTMHFAVDRPVAVLAFDTGDHLRAVMPILEPMIGSRRMLLTGVEMLSAAQPQAVH